MVSTRSLRPAHCSSFHLCRRSLPVNKVSRFCPHSKEVLNFLNECLTSRIDTLRRQGLQRNPRHFPCFAVAPPKGGSHNPKMARFAALTNRSLPTITTLTYFPCPLVSSTSGVPPSCACLSRPDVPSFSSVGIRL